MTELLTIGGIISLVAAIGGSLIALTLQQGYWRRTHVQQQAWQCAQEGHQSSWEVKHEKRITELERKLTSQVQEIQSEWQTWEKRDATRDEALAQRHETAAQMLTIEREVARLPLIEDTPVTVDEKGQRQHAFADWRPPLLQRANLSRRDLSHRYLGRADLREAHLVGTNFFMSDLSKACLAGANLSGADLSGADLSGADLRNATLTGANLQVADLHNAVLIGANLLGARKLTTQQVYSAIYDSTTHLDAEVDLTIPRLPVVHPKVTDVAPGSAPVTTETTLPQPSLPTAVPDSFIEIESELDSPTYASMLSLPEFEGQTAIDSELPADAHEQEGNISTGIDLELPVWALESPPPELQSGESIAINNDVPTYRSTTPLPASSSEDISEPAVDTPVDVASPDLPAEAPATPLEVEVTQEADLAMASQSQDKQANRPDTTTAKRSYTRPKRSKITPLAS